MPEWNQPTHIVPDEVVEKGLRYAMALGVVISYGGSRKRGPKQVRRWHVDTLDGESYVWTPAQVMAFTAGVRLATERKG